MVDNFTCFFHLIMKGEFVYSIVTFYGNVDVTLCSRDITERFVYIFPVCTIHTTMFIYLSKICIKLCLKKYLLFIET